MKPAGDPKADELRNKNLAQPMDQAMYDPAYDQEGSDYDTQNY
jgi:hypothetical protein